MFIRSLISGLFGTFLLSQNAAALSCMAPELERTMEKAKASDTLYHILVGKFETLPEVVPYNGQNVQSRNLDGPAKSKTLAWGDPNFQQKSPTIRRAWFSGYSLSPNRRTDVRLSRMPIDIEVSCAGPWCGSVPAKDQRHIAFVEARANQAPILKISACPDMVFPQTPKSGQIKTLRQCFDRTCTSNPNAAYGRYHKSR